jgi:hypothetical protein
MHAIAKRATRVSARHALFTWHGDMVDCACTLPGVVYSKRNIVPLQFSAGQRASTLEGRLAPCTLRGRATELTRTTHCLVLPWLRMNFLATQRTTLKIMAIQGYCCYWCAAPIGGIHTGPITGGALHRLHHLTHWLGLA